MGKFGALVLTVGLIIGKAQAAENHDWPAYGGGEGTHYSTLSQINRDNGWNVLGREGFEPVRMVAIDEDWSAVRFRRAGFIKMMTRAKEHLLSERAKNQK